MAVIPIFVSSTFRDFHGERDAIQQRVKPLLDAAVAPFGARCEFLDLRWGIDTSRTQAELAQQQVLDVCLREIDRCRPLFVALLGDRFGWVPPQERLRAAADAAGLSSVPSPPDGGPSITALECWHGGLERQEPSVFVLRHLAGDPPSDWFQVDQSGVHWLRGLIDDARQKDPERIKIVDYVATVRSGAITEDDLERFSQSLLDALKPLVEARAKTLAGDESTPYATAAAMLSEARTAVVVGRDALLASIEAQLSAGGPASKGVCLVGPSGVGKTTVLLAACARLAAAGRPVARVLVGVGPDSTSTSNIIAILSEQLGLRLPSEILSEELLLAWWQAQLESNVDPSTVIAIDGLDRLDRGGPMETVSVLSALPGGKAAVFLASTASASQANVLQQRGFARLYVEPLDVESVEQAANLWALSSGRRQLPESAAAVLASRPRSGLWVRLAVDELAWLTQQDYAAAEGAADAGEDPSHAIAALLTAEAARLPDGDEDLVGLALSRTRRTMGDEAGKIFTDALSLTRFGLALTDLQSLSGASPLETTRARWLLGAQITQRDLTGRLAFDHPLVRSLAEPPPERAAVMRAAVCTTLVPSKRPIDDPSRLSDTVTRAYDAASRISESLGHTSVGPDHLILGLLQLQDCQTTQTLISLGLDYTRAEEFVRTVTDREVSEGWDSETEQIFNECLHRARQPGHVPSVVTSSDLLMACIAKDKGAQVLAAAGVTSQMLTERLRVIWNGGYYGNDGHSFAFSTQADTVDVLEAFWQALLSGDPQLLAYMMQVAVYRDGIRYGQLGELVANAVVQSRGSEQVLNSISRLRCQPNMIFYAAPIIILTVCLDLHARNSLTLQEAFALADPLLEFVSAIPENSCPPPYLRSVAFSTETLTRVLLETHSSKERSEAATELAGSAVRMRKRLHELQHDDPQTAVDLATARLLQLRVLVESGERKRAKVLFPEVLDDARSLHDTSDDPERATVLLHTLLLGVEASVGSADPLDPVAQLAVGFEPIPERVVEWAAEAVSLARARCQREPSSLQSELDLVRGLIDQGRTLALYERPDASRQCVAEALALADSLSRKHPNNNAVNIVLLQALAAQFFVLPDDVEDLVEIPRRVKTLSQDAHSLSEHDPLRRAYLTAEAAAWRNQGYYFEFLGRLGSATRSYIKEYGLARKAGEGRIRALANIERVGNRGRRVFFGWPSLRAIGFDVLLLVTVVALGFIQDRKGRFVSRGFAVFEFSDDRESEELLIVPKWSGSRSPTVVFAKVLVRLVSRVVALVVISVATVWLFLSGHWVWGGLAAATWFYSQVRGQYEELLPG